MATRPGPGPSPSSSARTGPADVPAPAPVRSVRPDEPAVDPLPEPDATGNTSFTPPSGVWGADEREIGVFTQLVEIAFSIPEVGHADWTLGSESTWYVDPLKTGQDDVGFDPYKGVYPYVAFLRKMGIPNLSVTTNTSEVIDVTAVVKIIVLTPGMADEDFRTASAQTLRIESALRDRIEGNSFGGLVCPHYTSMSRGRPVTAAKSGTMQYLGETNYELLFSYIRQFTNTG